MVESHEELLELLSESGRVIEVKAMNLHLDAVSSISDLTSKIQSQPCTQCVTLSCSSDEPCWTSPEQQDDIVALFEAIGSLESLESVDMNYLGMGNDGFQLSLLSTLLRANRQTQSSVRRPHHLKSLRLTLVGLDGDEKDMNEFAQEIEKQVCLQEFQLDNCRLSHQLRASGCTLDAVVLALSKLPDLETTYLLAEFEQDLGRIEIESLQQLCESNSLRKLHLGGFASTSKHVEAIAKCLSVNKQSMMSSLKELHIELFDGEAGATALSQMLRVNNSLRALHVLFSSCLEPEDKTRFLLDSAEALKHNESLQDFRVSGCNQNGSIPQVEKAFAAMLEDNTTLESFAYSKGCSVDGPFKQKMDVLLRLNRYGRRALLHQFESTSKDEWIFALAQACHDMDCSFHLLQMNPNLCRGD